MKNKSVYIILAFILFFSSYSMSANNYYETNHSCSDYNLPPPLDMNASIENVIHKRTCIRNFSVDPVTDKELSTVLWSAYGVTTEGKRTVSSINGSLAVKIYVMKEDGVYWYDPLNHSLIFHKEGDYRGIGQYWAPVVLGLAWDMSLNKNENIVGTQMGQVGQNIILSSISIGLGTVPCNDFISPLMNIDLPLNEVGKLVFPLGHPKYPPTWKYRPLYFSLLPRIRDSGVSLTNLFKNISKTEAFDNQELTRKNISQLLWACYGYSYYIDINTSLSPFFGQRHRTVPSGHGYYPLRIYAVTSSGIYCYIYGLRQMDPIGMPIVSFLWKIRQGDYRDEIAESSQSFVKDAPLLILYVLNIEHTRGRGFRGDDFSSPKSRWIWYYEAGSCVQNVLLDSTAWGLSGNVIEFSNKENIRSILRLNNDFVPLFVTPVGCSSI